MSTDKTLPTGGIIARLEALKVRAEADKATFLSHRAIVFAARGYSQEEIAKRLQDMQDLADMMLAGLQAVIDHEVWLAGRKDSSYAPSV